MKRGGNIRSAAAKMAFDKRLKALAEEKKRAGVGKTVGETVTEEDVFKIFLGKRAEILRKGYKEWKK